MAVPDKNGKVTIGDRLLRFAPNRSMNQLADLLDVSTSTVKRWVDGEADPGTAELVAMANLTGQNMDVLAGRIPGPAALAADPILPLSPRERALLEAYRDNEDWRGVLDAFARQLLK